MSPTMGGPPESQKKLNTHRSQVSLSPRATLPQPLARFTVDRAFEDAGGLAPCLIGQYLCNFKSRGW